MRERARTGFLVCLLGTSAFAHKGSDTYWTLRAQGDTVSGRFDIALRDVNVLLGQPIDTQPDESRLRLLLVSALRITQHEAACPLELGQFAPIHHSDGEYLAVPISARCPQNISELDVEYTLLFEHDPQHRGLLSVSGEEGAHWLAFTSALRKQRVTVDSVTWPQQLKLAFLQGVHHIVIGWDHLCFLLALLLPSVLRRNGGQWEARSTLKSTLLDVTKVVTAFTVAHSITLGLSAFGMLVPNLQWVEVAIAASVALAALNNLTPFVPEMRWMLAFCLGLMHGFGFVSAISDLGATGILLGMSVFGFNVGVEAGQMALVACFVPLAFLARRYEAYRRVVFPLGSAVILGVALYWTTERLGLS